VLTIATKAAKTGVKGNDEDCARMTDREKRPFPRIRFSPNSSGTTCLMFETLTYPVSHTSILILRDGTYLVNHTIYTLSQGIPTQSLVFRARLVFCRFRLHRPQPRWWDVRSSSPCRQHLCKLCFRSCILVLLGRSRSGDCSISIRTRYCFSIRPTWRDRSTSAAGRRRGAVPRSSCHGSEGISYMHS
jgi:hypothetical protein